MGLNTSIKAVSPVQNSGNNETLRLGLGLGLGLGIPVLIGVGILVGYLIMRRCKNRKEAVDNGNEEQKHEVPGEDLHPVA